METKTLIKLTKYRLKTKFLFERKIFFAGWLEVFTIQIQIPHPILSSLQYEVVNNHNKWVLLSVPSFPNEDYINCLSGLFKKVFETKTIYFWLDQLSSEFYSNIFL